MITDSEVRSAIDVLREHAQELRLRVAYQRDAMLNREEEIVFLDGLGEYEQTHGGA